MSDNMESTFSVGKHKVTVSIVNSKLQHVLTPDMPKKLSEDQMEEYRRGRDFFLEEYARVMDIRIIVAEI
jgi:23S rRNA maturation mini-RNase III